MTTAIAHLDIDNLTHLIEEKNFVEAKKVIDGVLDEELTPVQKGEIYVKIASIYLAITNKLNREYIAELDTAIDLLKKTTSSEKITTDKLKVVEVRQNLASNS